MNLYIGNLNYNVREGDLRGVMEEYGTVASVKLITDRETRRSKGFAFVEMPNDDEAKEAIKQLNGAEYVNRTMVVKAALPKASGIRHSTSHNGGRVNLYRHFFLNSF